MSQLLPPILLTVCETEPEEVDDHERQYRRPRDGQVQLTIQQSRVQLRTQARFKPANMCTLRDVVRHIAGRAAYLHGDHTVEDVLDLE